MGFKGLYDSNWVKNISKKLPRNGLKTPKGGSTGADFRGAKKGIPSIVQTLPLKDIAIRRGQNNDSGVGWLVKAWVEQLAIGVDWPAIGVD